MKIRWYHWMVYELWRKVWGPILVDKPWMVDGLIDQLQMWREDQKKPRGKLTIVK